LEEKLKSPNAIVIYTVFIIALITFLTCKVRYQDTYVFLSSERHFKNVKIVKRKYFIASVEVDSNNIKYTGYVINAYNKLYILNLH